MPFFIGLFFGICVVYLLAGVGTKTNRVIQSSGREIICSVHAYFQQEYEAGGSKIPLQRIIERTASAVGRSEKKLLGQF